MDPSALLGVLTVVCAGLLMGSSAWPIKLMHRFKYEHWAIVANTVGIVLVPWCVTLLFCPNAFEAYRDGRLGAAREVELLVARLGRGQRPVHDLLPPNRLLA